MTQAKRLTVGVLMPIHNLAPKLAQDAESTLVVRQVFQSPFTVDPGTTDVEPVLFTGPLVPEDFGGVRGYRGQVRTDATFSDGTKMTAEDVVASLRDAALISEQATVDQDGDWVIFRLKRDNAKFHVSLSHPKCSIVRSVGEQVIGTGPYRVDPASEPTHLRLIPNPHWPTELALSEVLFKAYPLDERGRPKALLEAIRSGEVDLCMGLARDDIKDLGGVRKSILPAVSTSFLYLNVESPKLADVRVRRVLAHSIDRLALAKVCYENPLAFAASSILPRPLGVADDGLIHDPHHARTLLAEPGVKLPEKLELLTTWGPRPYLPRPIEVADEIAAQLGQIGVEIEVIRPRDISDFCECVIAGRHDLVVAGWLADTLDPCDFLDSVLASERVPSYENIAFSANHARLASADVDEGLHAYRAQPTPTRLTSLLEAVSREAAVVPILYGAAVTVWSYRVQNLQPSATEEIPIETLDLV